MAVLDKPSSHLQKNKDRGWGFTLNQRGALIACSVFLLLEPNSVKE
jgi:hypothetical protein